MMTYPVYLRYEVLRSFRNWRFVILTLAFPLVLYVLIGSVNRHAQFQHVAFPFRPGPTSGPRWSSATCARC